MGADVVIKDLGWNRIQEEIRRANRSFVKVGFPDGEKIGDPSQGESGHERFIDMSEVQAVAAVHEFGAPRKNIPERSFVRSAFDENRDKITAITDAEYQKILNGKSTVEDSLKRIGLSHEAQVKAKITKGPFTPLKPSTIARKKSSRPLIDTAQMRNSVTSAVFVK